MDPQQEVVRLLQEELSRLQMRNSSYSLRALAKRVGASPSVLSEILNGRRPVTRRTGEHLLAGLMVPAAKRQLLLSKLPNRNVKGSVAKRTKATDDMAWTLLEANQFDAVSNWYYFAILSLAETSGFKSDTTWIANRLGIKVTDAKRAVATLLRLELLKNTKDGSLKPTGLQFRTTDQISNSAVRKNHFQQLEVLRRSLENDQIEERDFSSVTLTFDPAHMTQAKEMIRNFRRQFAADNEKTRKQEVYRLSIQFVPLTRRESK
jgi:uncharacterized protein (TIGR02147 family)